MTLLICVKFSAQKLEVNPTSIFLKTSLEEYFDEPTKSTEIIENRYYRIISFSQPPDNSTKTRLMELGVHILDYIPSNNYLVSIPVLLSKPSLKGFGITYCEKVPSAIKYDPILFESPLPEWASDGDLIKVAILLMQDVNYNLFIQKFSQFQARTIETNAYAKIVRASVSISTIQNLIEMPEVCYISLVSPPAIPEDIKGKSLHRSNSIYTNIPNGRRYDGTGVSIAVNDDGFVGPHIDFQGRMEQNTVANDFTGDHGDMVAGILGGAGNLNPMYEGMAKGVKMHIRQYSGSLPGSVQLHQDSGVMLFSSSYGNGCNAGYTSLTRQVDQEIRLNPSLIQVFSCGNSGSSNCGYGAGSGWGNITGGHKQGKNVIATANLLNNGNIVNSSSRGPASDGRIKPDLAANGNGQMSTDPFNVYASGSGTSAAAPGVSGVLAQLYQAYRDLNNGVTPESGFLKATLLNTAEDYGNIGPDFTYGWGRINAYRAVRTLEEKQYLDSTIIQGETHLHQIDVPANVQEMKVMIYWIDREALPSSSKALVNDIDLKITKDGDDYFPWVLNSTPNSSSLSLPATTGFDHLNNMEQVTIYNPLNDSYQIEVSGFNIPFGPQKYFLLYEFIYDEITVTYPIGGEGLHPFDVEFIHWDANFDTLPFNISYTTDNGQTWKNIGTVNAEDRIKIWQIPNQHFEEVKIKVERGSISDESDDYFTIIKDPDYLSVDSVCLCYLTISWDSVPGADRYEVMVLGDKFMDPIGQTKETFYRIPHNYNDDLWYTVRAINRNGTKGRRQVAKFYNGNAAFNCSYGSNFESNDRIRCVGSIVKFEDKSLGCPHTWNWSFNPNTISFVNGTSSSSKNPHVIFEQKGEYEVTLTSSNQFYTDSKSKLNYVSIIDPVGADIQENFEGNTFPPAQWIMNNTISNLSWESVNVVQKNGLNGKAAVSKNDLFNTSDILSLTTLPIYIDENLANPYLTFDLSYAANNPALAQNTEDELYLIVSSDCGENYSDTIFFKKGMNLVSTTSYNSPWTPSKAGDWKKESISLYPYLGQTIKISFLNKSFQGNRLYIDNINVYDNQNIDYNPLNFDVFPNPNSGVFQLYLENHQVENITIDIFDVTGKIILNESVNFDSHATKILNYNLNFLSKGIYYIKLSEGNLSHVKPIIITNE